MFTPALGAPYIEPNNFVHRIRLGIDEKYVYLGRKVTKDGSVDAEILLRIQKDSVGFGQLERRIWATRDITNHTKVYVYRTCVLRVLIYASKNWTQLSKHKKILEPFQQKYLRLILNVKWESSTPDSDVLLRAKCQSIETLGTFFQMRWTGHIIRIKDNNSQENCFMVY